MKKFLLVIALLSGIAFGAIDEYKSDVYFANGIDTNKRVAYSSSDRIKEEFKLSHPKNHKHVKEWKVVYNHTHGIGIDLYESFLQKIYEDKPGSSLVPFIWNMSEISDYFIVSFKGVVKRAAKKMPKEAIKKYASKVAKRLAKKTVLIYNKKYGKKYTQEQIELMFDVVFDYLIEKSINSYVTQTEDEIIAQERADVQTHLKAYEQSIRDGHGVVIVAHSQGNLFVNRAYHSKGSAPNYELFTYNTRDNTEPDVYF